MKKVAALMMVKDEIDIIESAIHYLCTQELDAIFVYDNNSSDGTLDCLYFLEKKYMNLCVEKDPIEGYYQSDKMNAWANELFLEEEMDVVIPIDADEIWYSKDPQKTLGEAIRTSDADIFVAHSEDYIPTIFDDFNEFNFIKRMKHKKFHSNSFSAVAFNYSPGFHLEMGNHNVLNHPGKRNNDLIGIRHYQYRSFDQFVKKVKNGKKAYEATDLPDFMGSHWRKLGAMDDEELRQYWVDYCSVQTVESSFS
jgi:hypothetical protein